MREKFCAAVCEVGKFKYRGEVGKKEEIDNSGTRACYILLRELETFCREIVKGVSRWRKVILRSRSPRRAS